MMLVCVFVCACLWKARVGWVGFSPPARGGVDGGGGGGVVYTSSLSTLTKLPPILAVPDP
jgi:hypothetical protein